MAGVVSLGRQAEPEKPHLCGRRRRSFPSCSGGTSPTWRPSWGAGGKGLVVSVLVGPLGPALLTSLLRGPFQVLQSLNLSSRSLFILGSPADVNLMLSVQKTPRMSLTNEWRSICSLKGPDNLR